ncbi:hypothetical protein BT96DRAFT_1081734 [Gymnopus androsaceus JB14]|uniref:Uncharacterized protein n=1 Tax=Gymnopus androsaceus JB14 TaxID=1447944 RepID=A0A6A4HZP2_9AGAR|nr:hypothetical protein BT96DRAFT_1081734 [Gymnopus androsaceus JB14]
MNDPNLPIPALRVNIIIFAVANDSSITPCSCSSYQRSKIRICSTVSFRERLIKHKNTYSVPTQFRAGTYDRIFHWKKRPDESVAYSMYIVVCAATTYLNMYFVMLGTGFKGMKTASNGVDSTSFYGKVQGYLRLLRLNARLRDSYMHAERTGMSGKDSKGRVWQEVWRRNRNALLTGGRWFQSEVIRIKDAKWGVMIMAEGTWPRNEGGGMETGYENFRKDNDKLQCIGLGTVAGHKNVAFSDSMEIDGKVKGFNGQRFEDEVLKVHG